MPDAPPHPAPWCCHLLLSAFSRPSSYPPPPQLTYLGAAVGFYSGNVQELLEDVTVLKPQVGVVGEAGVAGCVCVFAGRGELFSAFRGHLEQLLSHALSTPAVPHPCCSQR